ncbi:DNA cytosine methyltransferase [Flavobacterium sp.]|uniref:DNA cytosine methyltransferase n=1 Tax=Flavobacterium sp. TaxID=239 RepID=UPI002B4B4A7E|nr:DNA cytosine methyltransferase [Flavobacterium sp.]HLP64190.1 DNA cytosine methyltransferase [Flavobacterium sp.]
MKEKISIDEFDGKKFKIRFVEEDDNRKAVLTHYLHNYRNGVKSHFEKEATEYLKQIIEYKNQEENISIASDVALQQLLFEVENVPFPTPEKYTFKFIDLFAGIGGFRLALQNLGGKCVFTSEWDEFAKKTYRANFGETPFGDITKDQNKNYIPNDFDILCAGFPCQPFSYAGRNEGFKDQTRGTLFFDILEILEKHRPKVFFLENVKGLVSHEKGKTLETILNSLTTLGYHVHWKVLNSLDFGVPQKRERWYCVGFDKETDFEFPEGNKNIKPKLKDIIEQNNDLRLKLTDFELERIKYHFDNSKTQERVLHDSSKYNSNTKKGRHGVFSFQKSDNSLRFHVGDASKTQIQEAFYACLETYAPTIIANRVPKLWDIERKLSVLESKRLQSFPDNFIFPVSDNQAYKQLGNSVTLNVIQAIAEKIINIYK